MMRGISFLLLAVLLLFSSAFSQEAYRLPEVVVTATAVETKLRKLPVTVQVITEREIRESGAANLADLLSEKLAGHIHKYPGLLTSVGIRGFRTDTHGAGIKGRVLILIDGHRAGTGNVAEIPLENVERIEIVRGPASVIYGSAAMGGVVNVITKKGKGKPTVKAGFELGSWDHRRYHLESWGELGRLNYSFSVAKERKNDYKDGNDDEVDNTDFHSWRAGFRLGFSPAEGHEISLVGQFTEFKKVGVPGPRYSPDENDYKDVRRKYISLSYDGKLSERVFAHVSYYYVQDSVEWHDPDKAWGYFETKTLTNTQGLRLRGVLTPMDLLRLTIGFDWDGIRVKNAKYPSGTPFSPNSAYDNYAGYVQAEINRGRLYAVAGIRYDYWKEELRPTQSMVLKTDEEDYDHVTWRVGLSYFIFDWLKARAAVGTAFRTPSADELSGRFVTSWSKIVGNPDLDPETTITYEAGLDVKKGSLRLGVGFFHTDYDDRISGGFKKCIDGDCTWKTYKNVDGAVIEGLEFYGSYDFGELFELPFVIRPYVNGVTYVRRELNDHDFIKQLESKTIPYVSKWNVTGGLELGLPEKIWLNLSFFYVGEQEVQEWNWKKPNYEKAKHKGGFTVFNLRFGFKPCKHSKFFIAVENLFDKNYSFVDYYPMPGRSVKVGLEVAF